MNADRLARMTTTPDPLLVDAIGKACPVPVIDLARALADVEIGTEVLVLADDPGAKVDIPVWCRMKRQELVRVDEHRLAERSSWRFLIRRIV
jgi:TusA-related sulfurtransferase